MPIRTGLDSRIEEVRAELREYFAEAKTAYTEAIEAFTKLDSEVYSEVKKIRQHAREVNWGFNKQFIAYFSAKSTTNEGFENRCGIFA